MLVIGCRTWLLPRLGCCVMAPTLPDPMPKPPAAEAAAAEPRPMVDAFISYSRHDAAIAARLATTLRSEGFDVWFDQHIRAGAQWEHTLRGVLATAKSVLVLWSERSVQSHCVTLEAHIVLKTRRLVPAKIDDCALPAGFSTVETALLPGWTGGPLVVPCGKQRLKVLGGLGADGRVKAARRAPEGPGLDATGCPATLAKGLSANGFLAGNSDGRGRLAPFLLAGRAGGRVTGGGCGCECCIPHETA